jgi:hypothetical protein
MTKSDEDPIQSIWKSQPILTVSITPEDMRARAAQFETETRRRNRVDYVSFALVAIFFGIGALTVQGVVVRVGALLLTVWAVIGLYSVRRFHGLRAQRSTESSPSSCAAWYQQQLERQRDVALSRPWGIALALPGFALLLVGYVDNGVPWTASVLLGGLGLFGGVAVVIHGKILAGRWQEEINFLQKLRTG